MNLIEFSVKNYRSITEIYRLKFDNYTVLIGPNNEGKSNILKALVLGLGLLAGRRSLLPPRQRPPFRSSYRDISRDMYDWERDFPVALRDSFLNENTELSFTFSLTEDEQNQLFSDFSYEFHSELTVVAHFSRDSQDVFLDGNPEKLNRTLSGKLADFINNRLAIQYIPAVRDSDLALDIVNRVFEYELSKLEDSDTFQALLNEIEKQQKPIRDKLARELAETIRVFIPELRKISIEPDTRNVRSAIRSSFNIIVDDGVETNLALKGDGIQSLAALSILRHVSQQGLAERTLILAVEEPESHLHPNAIHNLRKVLMEISQIHIVLITTHSPMLVNRENINANIIVSNGAARAAENVRQIREKLGVKLSDNLASAELILLVEGTSDRIILETWLCSISKRLKRAQTDGKFAIEVLHGASKLPYISELYRNLLCKTYAVVDDDEEGRKAIEDSIKRQSLNNNEYTLLVGKGMPQAELEDLVDLSVYEEYTRIEYGVELNNSCFRNSKSKWSKRMDTCFRASGKLWNDMQESNIKTFIAQQIQGSGIDLLHPAKKEIIDNIASALENALMDYTIA